MSNIYITGHGFMLTEEPAIKIPHGLNVRFYCKDETEFDSSWEPTIVNSAGGAVANPKKGLAQWEIKTFVAGDSCCEHMLSRPGAQKTLRSLVAMVEIKTAVAEGVAIDAVADGDILCVKGGAKQMGKANLPGKPTCKLSDILKALQGKFQGTVHWCACRSSYDKDDQADIEAQAAGGWLGLLVY